MPNFCSLAGLEVGQKNCGFEKIVGPKKSCAPQKISTLKIFGPKKFQVKKYRVQKIRVQNILCLNMSHIKKHVTKKELGSKKYLV